MAQRLLTHPYEVTTGVSSPHVSVRAHSRACVSEPPSPGCSLGVRPLLGGEGSPEEAAQNLPLNHMPFCAVFVQLYLSTNPEFPTKSARHLFPSSHRSGGWKLRVGDRERPVCGTGLSYPDGNFSNFSPLTCSSSSENFIQLPHFAPDLWQMH